MVDVIQPGTVCVSCLEIEAAPVCSALNIALFEIDSPNILISRHIVHGHRFLVPWGEHPLEGFVIQCEADVKAVNSMEDGRVQNDHILDRMFHFPSGSEHIPQKYDDMWLQRKSGVPCSSQTELIEPLVYVSK